MILTQIECILFLEYREKIEGLSRSISGAKIISNEVDKARELLKIINKLLKCSKYDIEKEDCENCRFILRLRKETAESIIRVNRIEAS